MCKTIECKAVMNIVASRGTLQLTDHTLHPPDSRNAHSGTYVEASSNIRNVCNPCVFLFKVKAGQSCVLYGDMQLTSQYFSPDVC
jgi:hypothetical protein